MAERIVGYRLKIFADDNNLRVLEDHAKAAILNEQNIQTQREKLVTSANNTIAKSYDALQGYADASLAGMADRLDRLIDRSNQVGKATDTISDSVSNMGERITTAGDSGAVSLETLSESFTTMGDEAVESGGEASAAIDSLSSSIAMAEGNLDSLGDNANESLQNVDTQAGKATRSMETLEQATREADAAQEQLNEATRNYDGARAKISLDEIAESTGKVARGVALFGLAGEENTEKLVQGLLKVQGAFDLLTGGVKLIKNINAAYEAYRASVVVAAAAQRAASANNVQAIAAETVATDALASARARAAAAGIASRNAGAAGGIGNAVGGAAGSAITGAGGGIAGSIATKVGASAVGGSGAIAAGAGLAALATTAFALKSSFESLGEAVDNGVSGGAAAGSYTETVGGSIYNPAAYGIMAMEGLGDLIQGNERNSFAEWRGGAEKSAALDSQLVNTRADRIQQQERDTFKLENLFSQLNDTLGSMEPFGADTGERAASLAERRETLESRSGEILSTAGDVDSDAQEQAALQLEQVRMGLLQEEFQLRKEIRDERIQEANESLAASREELSNAQESLRIAEDELKTTEQSVKAEQERLMTAKERFGAMSKADQQEVIRIKRKAETEGIESLEREEISRLGQVGTDDAQAIVSQANRLRADQSGFDDIFGGSQRERIDQGQQEIERRQADVQRQRELTQRIEAEVQVNTELVVKVEQDNQAIINSVRDQIRGLQRELNPQIQEVARQEFEKMRGELLKQQQGRREALQGSLSGAGSR